MEASSVKIQVYFYILRNIDDLDNPENTILMEDFEKQSKERQDIFGNDPKPQLGELHIKYIDQHFSVEFEFIFGLLNNHILNAIPFVCEGKFRKSFFECNEGYNILFEPVGEDLLKIEVNGTVESNYDNKMLQQIIVPKKEFLRKIYPMICYGNELMDKFGYREVSKKMYEKYQKAEEAMRSIGIEVQQNKA